MLRAWNSLFDERLLLLACFGAFAAKATQVESAASSSLICICHLTQVSTLILSEEVLMEHGGAVRELDCL